MSDFEWEDPPEPTRRIYRRHDIVARRLRSRPGQWARVGNCPTDGSARHLASRINTGQTLAYLPVGAFEAIVREVGEEFRVYARYLGEGGDE